MRSEPIFQQPNPIISAIINRFTNSIWDIEKKYSLPPDSLLIQLCLHIYKYSLEDIFSCSQFDIKKIKQYSVNSNLVFDELFFLANYLKQDLEIYNNLKNNCNLIEQDTKIIKNNGIYEELSESGSRRRVFFGEVSPFIGNDIQNKIHYIKCARQDTIYHFGLFFENSEVPFAYAAFSQLDRHYLLNLPLFKNVQKNKIFVLTRAYSFPNSPHNAMSVLYSQCFKYMKKEVDASYVVTALNQNLFFDGSSLKSVGMKVIATSPMKYFYTDGLYSTRRKLERTGNEFKKQKFIAPPIMWFGKNLVSTNNSLKSNIERVSVEMYDSK